MKKGTENNWVQIFDLLLKVALLVVRNFLIKKILTVTEKLNLENIENSQSQIIQ